MIFYKTGENPQKSAYSPPWPPLRAKQVPVYYSITQQQNVQIFAFSILKKKK